MDYLGSLSATQLTLLFDVERTEDGHAKIRRPAGARPPGAEQLFRRRCYLNAVTDPATVDRLWAAERVRMAEAEADAKQRAKDRARKGRRAGKGKT